jgi:hypothetical protein
MLAMFRVGHHMQRVIGTQVDGIWIIIETCYIEVMDSVSSPCECTLCAREREGNVLAIQTNAIMSWLV